MTKANLIKHGSRIFSEIMFADLSLRLLGSSKSVLDSKLEDPGFRQAIFKNGLTQSVY